MPDKLGGRRITLVWYNKSDWGSRVFTVGLRTALKDRLRGCVSLHLRRGHTQLPKRGIRFL
jgi:hypothetical protein